MYFLCSWKSATDEKLQAQIASIKDDDRFYAGWVYISRATRKIIGGLEKVFFTDAAHCVGNAKGTMYNFVGRDANRHIVIIGQCHQTFDECDETWNWFYEHLVKCLGKDLDLAYARIISDGDKGLENAINKNFKKAKQFLCTRHRKDHVRKHGNPADKHLFLRMARANNVDVFNESKARLSKSAREYLAKTDNARQYMLYCKELKGCTTQSMSESLNAAGIELKYINEHKIL